MLREPRAMNSLRMEFDAFDIQDGMQPVWRWRILIDGLVAAKGIEPFLPRARKSAEDAFLAINA